MVPITPTPLARALQRLSQGTTLTAAEAEEAFGSIVGGLATPVQTAALLMGLRSRGETADEIAGAVAALRRVMVRLPRIGPDDAGDELVDTCGTGGGTVGTLNISTAAAFVVAGAGVPVAKHGNRSFTSRSGSADVLEALGVDISLAPERAAEVLAGVGLVFLFAPTYHPAMRFVGPTRRELAVPTIMNLLGPMLNPAGARRQLVGVADRERAPLIAQALAHLGAKHALVVHGAVGMDEISPRGNTLYWEVREGEVRQGSIEPSRYRLEEEDLAGLAGGDPAENAGAIERLFDGDGHPAVRAAVLLNAGAALYVAGKGWTLAEAMDRAAGSLDGGRAAVVLEQLRQAAPRASTSG